MAFALAGSLSAAAQYSADENDPLITDASQITDNCIWKAQAGLYGEEKLIDGDHVTHFHSSANEGMNLYVNDEWLQIDLGRSDLSRFFLEFYGRSDIFHDTPSKLVISASNTPDDESSWKDIVTLDEGFPADVADAHYMSPCIDMGAAYRYVRMHVKATSTGNPYWNLSELQLYPAVVLTGYQTLQNLVDSIYAIDDVSFRTGTTAGYVSYEDSVSYATALVSALDLLNNSSATQEQYTEAATSLRNAFADTYAKIIPLATGNYFIESAYPAFKELQPGVTYAMAQQDDVEYATWVRLDTTTTASYFNITRLDNGNYLFRSLKDGRYMGYSMGDARTTVSLVNYTTEAVEQVLTPVGNGTFYIAAAASPLCYYHVVGHSEGAGTSGIVEPVLGKEVRELWAFAPADTSRLADIRGHEQQVLKAEALYDSLAEVRKKVVEVKSPSELILDATQLSENCVWQANTGLYGVDKLLDGDHVTHFHSSANEGKSLFTNDEWIQIDFGNDEVSKFVLEFWGRNDGFHDTPNDILITASNTPDDEASWTEIVRLDKGFPANIANAHYVSPVIDMKAPYQYVRMHVKGNTTGNPYWNISELQAYAYPLEATANSLYSKNSDVKAATDELEAAVATADDHIANLTVDGSEMQAINNALAVIAKAEAERNRLQAIADSATTLYNSLTGSEDQYNNVEGMKEVADHMKILADTMLVKIHNNDATAADGQELREAIAAVMALWQDRSGLEALIAKATSLIENTTEGTGMGQLTDASALETLKAAADSANAKIDDTPNTSEFNALVQTLQDAVDEFVDKIVQPVPGKWYYILSATDDNDSSPADGYYGKARAQVQGAALYVLSSENKGINEGEYNLGQLRWGMDDIKDKDLYGDPDAIWRFVAAPESYGKRAYYVQNLRTGWYIGDSNAGTDCFYSAADTTSVPCRLDYVGSGQFNLVPLAGNNAGVPISFGDNARQIRADVKTQAPNNRASLTFEEFSVDENPEFLIDFYNDSARIVTLPFAVSNINENEGVKAYAIHNVVSEDGNGVGIGLMEKGDFAAGEPFILVAGDTTNHSSESGLVSVVLTTPNADDMLTTLVADTANGLIGTFPRIRVKADEAHDYINFYSRLYVNTLESNPKGRNAYAHTGYIDPSLIVAQDGEPDAVLRTVNGTFRVEIVNAVSGAKTAGADAKVNVYSADGVLLRKGAEAASARSGLAKGVYIIGKEKVLVK